MVNRLIFGVFFVFMGLHFSNANVGFAEDSLVNRSPAVVAEAEGGFYPGKCEYPLNRFIGRGMEIERQRRNYDFAKSRIEECKGGMAFVSPSSDGRDWTVICSRETKNEYVMDIPESIRRSGKRYSVYNRTGKGPTFALDRLPTSTSAAGSSAYFSSVCTEKATVNFEISDCKTLSFNPSEYGSGKSAEAFLISEAASDCDKIAKRTDVEDSQKRLINRNVLPHLQGCRR